MTETTITPISDRNPYRRLPILFAIALVAGLAWILLALSGAHVPDPGHPGLTPDRQLADLGVIFAMWSVMAVAMMLPTAIPAIFTFADIQEAGAVKGEKAVTPAMFASGYLCAWLVFALAAATFQWRMHSWTMASPSFADNGWLFGGLLLVGAGLYQWTPLKDACLTRCRSPMQFFLTDWHSGSRGAFRMGVRYGLICVGCCWLLMALMLITGMFNLIGMAMLTIYMLVEKITPQERMITRAAGLAAVLCGTILLITYA
jgi:predicted metal-binding membrane protein